MEESKKRPRIIPVMDIRGGIVVRAVAGRREEYKPLVSRLTDSTDPLVVAEALRRAAATDEFYVADLDAIEGARPSLALFHCLGQSGLRLWVDAGIRNWSDAEPILAAGVGVVVAGSETLHDLGELWQLGVRLGQNRLSFSLDLRNGQCIADPEFWGDTAMEILGSVVRAWSGPVIVLDLAHVGLGRGTGTEGFCARARLRYPHLELIAGGGVRGPEDLPALADAGVDAVLVASALHDGKFELPEAAL
jgi:phosphoribosylformimino-5-aminoimidazole carboxamide ribotide isomerase